MTITIVLYLLCNFITWLQLIYLFLLLKRTIHGLHVKNFIPFLSLLHSQLFMIGRHHKSITRLYKQMLFSRTDHYTLCLSCRSLVQNGSVCMPFSLIKSHHDNGLLGLRWKIFVSFSRTQRRATASGVGPRFRNLSITFPALYHSSYAAASKVPSSHKNNTIRNGTQSEYCGH